MNYSGSAPSAQEVGDMKRLIEMMNMNDSNEVSNYVPPAVSSPSAPVSHHSSVDGTSDMKAILESFYSASGDAVSTLISESNSDPVLREAIHTSRTPTGAVIGSWEVRVHLVESSGSERKVYDVLHPSTQTLLFKKLVIFEAAHAIVRYLNKGLATDHTKIQEIADLEEVFRRNRQDAGIFKKRYARCMELKEVSAAEVFEARYQRAKAQAIVANDSIKTILNQIR